MCLLYFFSLLPLRSLKYLTSGDLSHIHLPFMTQLIQLFFSFFSFLKLLFFFYWVLLLFISSGSLLFSVLCLVGGHPDDHTKTPTHPNQIWVRSKKSTSYQIIAPLQRVHLASSFCYVKNLHMNQLLYHRFYSSSMQHPAHQLGCGALTGRRLKY